jgi:hypothetical protein
MPPFLFFAVVVADCTNPTLQVSETIERIKRRHGEEVDLFHLFDDRVWMREGGS